MNTEGTTQTRIGRRAGRSRGRVRLLLAAAITALVATSLAACSGDGGERITVYSGRTESLVSPIIERFASETGIEVDVRYGQSADLALLIDEEGGRTPADVFFSQSPGAISFLAQQGHLAPLDPDLLGLVSESARSPEGLWVGLTGRIRVLVYNQDLVPEADLPRSVLDLTDPAYRGEVAVAPANGSFQDFVTGMRLTLGDDAALAWLEGMRDNGARTYANNNAIVEAVGRGEVPMGLVNHYYNARAEAENPSVPSENYIFPDGDIGAMNLVTGAGVLRASDRPQLARQLIEFLLSEEAQRFFSRETFEYPLASGVEPAHDLPPLSAITTPSFPTETLGGGLGRTKELIDASGLERG